MKKLFVFLLAFLIATPVFASDINIERLLNSVYDSTNLALKAEVTGIMSPDILTLNGEAGSDPLRVLSSDTNIIPPVFLVDKNNNVGIGVQVPAVSLDVNGSISGDNIHVGYGSSGVASIGFKGDPDTGFYRNTDNEITVVVDADAWKFGYGLMGNTATNKPGMMGETPTLINPTVCPAHGDSDTGLGGTGVNILALVCGGKSILSADSQGVAVQGVISTDVGLRLGAIAASPDATSTVPSLYVDSGTSRLRFFDGTNWHVITQE